ncbi:MAG: SDR family oxidoreductase [Chloroflexi bacterium]|nr:SDR family oxidoreductase [Chloroflexota bacterium]
MRLHGRVALITGAAQGIGRSTAIRFAEEGARVAIVDVDAPKGEATAAEIRASGGEALFLHHDIGEDAACRAMVEEAVAAWGRLDVLFNNAYWSAAGTVVELAPADWDRSMQVMLRAIYLGCKYAIPPMIAGGGGSIIATSSVHGVLAAARSAVYEAAKAGVINLMREIAVDFGHQGIRANAICPGWIVTERGEEWARTRPDVVRQAEVMYPVGRPGRPRDIANAALYLASDESSFVTGHALVVDGGLTCQLQDSLVERMAAFARAAEGKEQ